MSYAQGSPGGDPAALDPVHRAVHVEHLEHHLQPGAAQVDRGSSAGSDSGRSACGQDVEGAPTCSSGGKASEAKYCQIASSSLPGQQQHLGVLHAAAGAADLLVVGDRGGRRAEVHDEAEVGLVEAHAERGRGDQRLDPVGQQVLLGLLAVGVLRLARCTRRPCARAAAGTR